MKVIVLGCGLVGRAIALDLVKDDDIEVTVADKSNEALVGLKESAKIKAFKMNLSDKRIVFQLVQDYDLVIGALPGFMGFEALKTVIEAKKNIVDISFLPEDPIVLDDLAKRNGVIAVFDCGIAPGCCNVFMGYVDNILDETESYLCYVGGLPVTRQLPYQYKIVFSPVDVLEEYTRPARFVERGELVTRPALSDPELMDFQGVGTLEAFNTDGLRSLMGTMNAPFMKEKTLRYPGHIELMRIFRETGFFDKEPLKVGDAEIRPIDFTAALLFPKWKLEEGEEDITVMKVVIEGKIKGKRTRYVFNLLDRYDNKTHTTSMARTTGYTCSVVARLIRDGEYTRAGVSPPEYIGQEYNCYHHLMKGLKERGIVFEEEVISLEE
ncbi:saccharopine dehydrogenase NADP-binding domain-containing protein [bacterium]|nr:saccharopine dehydrogenase NADP-binding domain-containing protein [bacterium]